MRYSLSIFLLALAPWSTAAAQSRSAAVAYTALIFGPIGGLVPSAPATSAEQGAPAFTLRYAQMSESDPLLTIAGRVDVDAGPGRLGVTGGWNTCSGCDQIVVLGGDWHVPIHDRGIRLGLRPAIGLSRGTEGGSETAWSFALGAPLAAPLGGESGPVILPFVEPAFAVAGITGDEGDNGTRALVGGGVLLANRRGSFGLTLGFQRVLIDGGETMWGLGLTFGRGRR